MKSAICFLNEYKNLEEALIKAFNLTRSSIKKNAGVRRELKKKVYAGESYEVDLDILNKNIINPEYQNDEMEILHNDGQFLVLNKVHGVHSHPLKYSESDNCLSFLRKEGFSAELGINNGSYDRGLLFRLDKVTSGVLIYVKNGKLYRELRENYGGLVKKKRYLAIIKGRLGIKKELTHFFRESEKKGKRIQVFDKKANRSKTGKLTVVPVSYNKEKDATLVFVDLITGLRHQIRSQLAHIGYPIVGDEMYGGPKDERVYLHAYNYQVDAGEVKFQIASKKAFLFERFFNLDTCL